MNSCLLFLYNVFLNDYMFNDKGEMVFNLLFEYGCSGSIGDLIKTSQFVKLDMKRYVRGMLRGIYDIHEARYMHCDFEAG